MKRKTFKSIVILLLTAISAVAQTNEITYQGKLNDGAVPANGSYDMQFQLYALDSGVEVPVGTSVEVMSVNVVNGVFTAKLDFSHVAGSFTGGEHSIGMSVRAAGVASYTLLSPTQKITSAPYAIRSQNAESASLATDAAQLGGVAAGQYVLTNDSRMTDARAPTAGSANYIQNSTVQQAASDFHISGDGRIGGVLRADSVSSLSGYFSAATRILYAPTNGSTFVGRDTGTDLDGGIYITAVGENAAANVTTGTRNSFFGYTAGWQETTGSSNSYFGAAAGSSSVATSFNSIFGAEAGRFMATSDHNTFVGYRAGRVAEGGTNTFVGSSAGDSTTTGANNSFVGGASGGNNTEGDGNVFMGLNSGQLSSTGDFNVFLGTSSGGDNVSGNRNTFVGYDNGNINATGSYNTSLGAGTRFGEPDLTYATSIGAGSRAELSNSIYLGRPLGQDTVRIPGGLNLTGAASISGNLLANGAISVFSGSVSLQTLGSAGLTSLCRNGSNIISSCSSSLKYKSNLARFSSGLEVVKRLQPITFNWIDGGMSDLGLGAEDVEAIEPLLVTYDKDGSVEGVKYDRIGVVLVNAVKEQQEQIERMETTIEQQRQMIEKQNAAIESLKQIVCAQNSDAAICKEESR